MNYEKKNNPPSLQSIMEDFLKCFQSTHTKSAYQSDLIGFFDFCIAQFKHDTINLKNINETLCLAWRHSINCLPNKTLARKISAVSSFFNFCQRQSLLTTNPAKFLQRPKVAHIGKTNTLTYEEIEVILKYTKNHIQHAKIYQNDFQHKLWQKRYTILYILFTVGMRVEELCHLKISDLEQVEENLYRLHLLTKGNEKHAPLIHSKTAFVLMEYIKLLKLTNSKQYIFEGMHRSSVYSLVQICVKRAGIQKKISPHSLRASLATHLHKTGVPLGQIKDLLNHKNIATTLLYTKVSDEELQENSNILSF